MFKYLVMASVVLGFSVAQAKDEKKAPARTIASVDNFQCGGTEPFWGMEIKGSKMTYNDPIDNKKTTFNITEKLVPVGTSESFGFVVKANNGKSSVLATVRNVECNDGMSDNKYTHEIMYINGSTVFVGCCNKK